MHKIISLQNEKIKKLKKLQTKKYRQKYQGFIVENFKIIKDAFVSGFLPESLFVTDTFLKKQEKTIKNIQKKGVEIFLISQKINKSFSNLETSSGVCAIYDFLLEKKEDGKKKKVKSNYIYLNKISDPGNLGTILRSAVAFNFENIILDENCVDLYNSKVINAAKDAIFKLNFYFDNNLKLLKDLKQDKKILVTSLNEKSQDLKKVKIKKDFVLVLGNESNGVEKQIERWADKFIKIEMSSEIESLNVASSAAILFYNLKNL